MPLNAKGKIAVVATAKAGWLELAQVWKLASLFYIAIEFPSLVDDMQSRYVAAGSRGASVSIALLLLGLLSIFLPIIALFCLTRLCLVGRISLFRLRFSDFLCWLFRYFWKGLLLSLVISVIFISFVLAAMAADGDIEKVLSPGRESAIFDYYSNMPLLFHVPASASIFIAFLIFFPVLFSAAIGRNTGFRESWRKMHGNIWRCFAACLAPLFIGYAINWVAFLAYEELIHQTFLLWSPLQAIWVAIGFNSVLMIIFFPVIGWLFVILAQAYRDLWPLQTATPVCIEGSGRSAIGATAPH